MCKAPGLSAPHATRALAMLWSLALLLPCCRADSPSSTKPIKRLASLPRKKLGSSDLVVTELCAGTMTWGSFVKEEAEAHAQLDKLVELGVNFFDTAEIYPVAYNYGETTERWMGNWLEQRIAAGSLRREDVVIATKCNPAGIGSPEGTPHNFSLERLEASARASLARLKVESIDLYYLHFPTRMGFGAFGWASWSSPERYELPSKMSDGSAEDFDR